MQILAAVGEFWGRGVLGACAESQGQGGASSCGLQEENRVTGSSEQHFFSAGYSCVPQIHFCAAENSW